MEYQNFKLCKYDFLRKISMMNKIKICKNLGQYHFMIFSFVKTLRFKTFCILSHPNVQDAVIVFVAVVVDVVAKIPALALQDVSKNTLEGPQR